MGLRAALRRVADWHGGKRLAFSGAIAQAAKTYYFSYMSVDRHWHMTNGEATLLERLKPFGFKTVFDAGGNKGAWSALAHQTLPEATIHTFEIAPPTAERLVARFAGEDAVIVNSIGLSERAGTVEIRYYPDHTFLTGIDLDQLDPEWESQVMTVPVRTGADYIAECGMAPDLLKVDCEAHELAVLQGFGTGLHNILVVQFEFSNRTLHKGITLKHFYDLLPQHSLGRVLRNGVAFAPHHFTDELGLSGNFVAVRTDRQDIIDAVGL